MVKLRIGVLAVVGAVALGTAGSAWGKGPGSGNGNPNPSASSNAGGNGNGNGVGGSGGSSNSSASGKSKSPAHGNSNAGGSHGKSNHTGPGDSNAGDVWVDNVGQGSGPGHEQDPHLTCTNINLWGSGLADTSGAFTIAGWPPSGHKETDYSGQWTYNHTSGRKSGSQVIAVINISTLIETAVANHDTQAKQGYHFKLNLVQDPQKHKTFWVKCAATPTGSSTTSTPTTTGSNTGSSPSSGAGVGGLSRGRHGKTKSKKLIKPVRHHRAVRRKTSGVSATAPAFTG